MCNRKVLLQDSSCPTHSNTNSNTHYYHRKMLGRELRPGRRCGQLSKETHTYPNSHAYHVNRKE